MRTIRRIISHNIYRWADKKYGVKARGEVKRFKTLEIEGETIGFSDFTPKQTEMVNKWHYWMNVKNRIYPLTK